MAAPLSSCAASRLTRALAGYDPRLVGLLCDHEAQQLQPPQAASACHLQLSPFHCDMAALPTDKPPAEMVVCTPFRKDNWDLMPTLAWFLGARVERRSFGVGHVSFLSIYSLPSRILASVSPCDRLLRPHSMRTPPYKLVCFPDDCIMGALSAS
ncbi:hypothetical protein B0J15DRAFT_46790 [Fusarium solani]|uniref:Uncharacterized protein n=1 Tax=Fusarium solani TaxID=169388 RepID=A0A9P9H3T5_FUSSL|nr:uncharacterized protein B0J15DRAFT_46790 [Fusarium solani]KAH7250623.1 hypothetical protein B0J15DRAFT_46790 [Fusarium solani]